MDGKNADDCPRQPEIAGLSLERAAADLEMETRTVSEEVTD